VPGAPARPSGEQCYSIDACIARCKRIKGQIDDKQTQEAVDRLLDELEAKKATCANSTTTGSSASWETWRDEMMQQNE
jgi:hypothetical protein